MPPPQVARAPAEPESPANYLDLYGLSKPPFGAAADTAGYILFGSHRRAFEALASHLTNGSGLLILVGPEGVGKTQALRSAGAVAAEAGRYTIRVSRPAGGRLTLNQLILALNGSATFGPVSTNEVVENFRKPPRKTVIAEDVELMPDDCISLLLALGGDGPIGTDAPAIVMSSSIELTGDPTRPDLAQLSSLAVDVIRMPPLPPPEIRQYIERSLWISGGTTRRLITSDALRMLVARSHGLPGMVDRLMEATFTAGFARNDAMITAKTVAAAVGPTAHRPAPRPAPVETSRGVGAAFQIIAASLLVAGISVFLYKAISPATDTPAQTSPARPATALRPPVPRPPPSDLPRTTKAPEGLPTELINALVKRGNEVLELGDIAAARLLFQRAAAAGNATAATALGKTYDPGFASDARTRDAARAAEWYQRAVALGDARAAELLKRLPPR